MEEVELLKRKLERERQARKQAESILEEKAVELYQANLRLKTLNQNLESEIQKRSASLAESEMKYRQLVEQAQDLIYNVDSTGVFTFVNGVCLTKIGCEEKDLLGKQFTTLLPLEQRQIAFEYFQWLATQDIVSDYQEFVALSFKGEKFWLGQNVTKVQAENDYYYSVVARDITQRKQSEKALVKAQEALEKSEVKYRSIMENMELGLMEVDNDGIILRVYDRFNEMLGYSSGELEGKNAIDAILVSGYEQILQREDARRKQGQTGVYEVKLKKKDGSEIWVLISGAPFYDEKGEITGSIGVHYDITDRKLLERQLEKAKEEAIKAQRAEKAFLANMSHEIRTPLNAIIGMSHLLIDTNLDAEQKEYLQSLVASSTILKSLISDILDISKIDSGTLDVVGKPTDLVELGRRLISTFKITSHQVGVELKFDVDDDLDVVIVDGQLLSQVFMNLLGNALKFVEEGEVCLTFKKEHESDTHYNIQFSVSDTGIGMSQEDLKSIFQEFKQANAAIRRKYGGTGLGLSISYQLVKLLGGNLQVESEVNKGTMFTFSLQLLKTNEKAINTYINLPPKSLVNSDTHILVVEDNELNRKYISSLLEKWGLNFDYCKNGVEATNSAKEKKYSLIFMDLQMPHMDGFEATRVIREGEGPNKKTPIVALTASTFLSKKRMALNAGMTDFLSKPFVPDQLSSIIEKYSTNQQNKNTSSSTIPFDSKLDVDYLQSAYLGDVDYALDMFETYVEVVNEEIILLKELVVRSDTDKVKKAIHKVKPIFTMVGLSSITRFLEETENELSEDINFDWEQWYETFVQLVYQTEPVIIGQINKLQEWQIS